MNLKTKKMYSKINITNFENRGKLIHYYLFCLYLFYFSLTPVFANNEADVIAAEKSVRTWLELVDKQNYDKSWEVSANLFKAQVKKRQWAPKINALRTKVGLLQSRTKKYSKFMTELPGAPIGKYVVFQYKSSFKNLQTATETIAPMKDSDGKWRVSRYFIN
jgi:hypothetical protein